MNLNADTVFVVDDEPESLRLCERMLRGFCQVRSFTDPRATLRAMRFESPTCLVVGHRVPGLNGLELVRECRKQGYEGAALLVTAHAGLDELALAEDTSLVYRVLSEPVAPEYFQDQIELAVADTRFRQNLEGRRRYPRFRLPLKVRIECGGEWFSSGVHDISVGGLRVDPDPRLVSGTPIRVHLARRTGASVTGARVVYSAQGSSGLEFTDPPVDFRDTVGELLVHARYGHEQAVRPD